MEKGQKVRVVDHEAYEGIHRVGDEGVIEEIKEEAVFVLFDGEEGAVEYPLDVVEPVNEKPATEQATPDAASWEARIKAAGGDPRKKREIVDAMVSELGVGRMDAGNILDRVQSGEPFERAYKGETGVGEAKVMPKEASRRVIVVTSSEEDKAEVQELLAADSRVIGIDLAPSKGVIVNIEAPTQKEAEEIVRSVISVGEEQPPESVSGVKPSAMSPIGRSEGTVSTRRRTKEQGPQDELSVDDIEMITDLEGRLLQLAKGVSSVRRRGGKARLKTLVDQIYSLEQDLGWVASHLGTEEAPGGIPGEGGVKEKIFRPIAVNVLEQGDKEDEYVTIGEGSAVRSEYHLVRAIRSAIRNAMESMERPFDVVDVVFRRAPVQEQKRRKAERELIASLHLLDEGKAKSADVRRAAQKAAKLGVKTARLESFTDDRYAKKILKEAMTVGGSVKIIWPPKELSKHLGQHVIVETRTADRLVGTLSKGPGRMFQIKTKSGTHKFSPNDVIRILVKPGAK